MQIRAYGLVVCAAFVLAFAMPVKGQDAQTDAAPTDTTPSDATTAAPTNGEPAAATPAESPESELPEVQVIQEQDQPPPAPPPETPVFSPAPQPAPQPTPAVAQAPAFPKSTNPIYGAQNSGGAAQRAYDGAMSPINPTSILPRNLENFTGDAQIITQQTIEEDRPRTVNEVFTNIPGVIVVNDDGNAQHGGIGIRGSPPRRSRKILVMNDGQPVNLALWLDPSVHYAFPLDRIEGFEVIRGTTIPYGPNNNFGVINARNYSPFGPNHTVISGSVGITWTDNGFFEFEDDEFINKSDEINPSGKWHFHTVQSHENVGIVFSYTGESVQGAWDSERLRFNDFYGAIGWKGVDQDLVVSLTYARQRDNYDESNLELEEEGGGGLTPEQAFEQVKHCKLCFAPGARFNTYNADIWRGQVVHNNYLDENTTITTRIYAQEHRRDRYQIATLEDDPSNPEAPVPNDGPDFGTGMEFGDTVFFGKGTMFGRLRTFRNLGAEVRAEFANLPFHGSVTQDIQMGVRYEYQDMTNRNFLGLTGQVLEDGDKEGLTIFDRNLDSDAVSGFIQTDIQATPDLNIVPGIRFEWYRVNRQSRVVSVEEGEAEEPDTDAQIAECNDVLGLGLNPADPAQRAQIEEQCLLIEGIERVNERDSTSSFVVLPGASFSYTGWYNTTVFGGYHRGLSTAVLRNENFPSPDEIGDNLQLGLRSKALLGVDFQLVGFYQFLENYQFGATFGTAGDRSFGRAPRVEIRGVELYGRLDSQPFHGGPYNWFFEGNYTYNNGIFTKNVFDGQEQIVFSGNRLPEVPFNNAALTVGVEDKTHIWPWNASLTWTYRGEFFTDAANSISSDEGEDGIVPNVWLLSARFNQDIGTTGMSWYVAGYNLLDEFYLTDREDGLKPGIGRSLWTGFRYKF